jgi:uncharacterized protein YceK
MTHITLFLLVISAFVSGCTTAVAIVDVTASTVIYAGKTVVSTIDAITPDIVND